eukprot:CAMPEP_0178437258 /NCGR_PEP_ID=MMETSP0689_2-20121128/34888_1 /TAXON_ID=160604 /ORGANISM="Amphidinium massartii, Strain CS-259" /LENGTH=48 /DNA_ID= /DNA_START= /DNA_END= /DNA_ORIENTATION=
MARAWQRLPLESFIKARPAKHTVKIFSNGLNPFKLTLSKPEGTLQLGT